MALKWPQELRPQKTNKTKDGLIDLFAQKVPSVWGTMIQKPQIKTKYTREIYFGHRNDLTAYSYNSLMRICTNLTSRTYKNSAPSQL